MVLQNGRQPPNWPSCCTEPVRTWPCLLKFSPSDIVCRRPLSVPPFCSMAPLSVTRRRWPGIRSGRTLFWGVFTLRPARESRGYELVQDWWSSVRLCRTCEVELPILAAAGPSPSYLRKQQTWRIASVLYVNLSMEPTNYVTLNDKSTDNL
jgi:hypothetical protein